MNAKASTAALRPPVRGCFFFGSAFPATRLAVRVPDVRSYALRGGNLPESAQHRRLAEDLYSLTDGYFGLAGIPL